MYIATKPIRCGGISYWHPNLFLNHSFYAVGVCAKACEKALPTTVYRSENDVRN